MEQSVAELPMEQPPWAVESASSGTHVAALILILVLGTHTLFTFVCYLLHYYDTVARRKEKPVSLFSYLRAFSGEWLFGIGIGLTYVFGFLRPRRTAVAVKDGGPPILLVHGYMMNRACMFALYWGLRRFGFQNVSTMNYWPIVGPIEAAARQIADRVRLLADHHDGESVVVVAHSMGGLATRAALRDAPDLPIAKVVAIATPHNGTQMAYFAIGPAAEQLQPGSGFLEGIAEPPSVALTSVYSGLDQIVFPPKSADFGNRSIRLDDLGHLAILFSPRTLEAVAGEIQTVATGRKPDAAAG
jgi:pimeloyl-ACP methyl ester carboxylesterase